MFAYLAAVWKHRYFWLSLVKMDLRARYRGSVLGIGWSLLQPIAMTVIICTVFSQLFAAEITFFAPFLMAGLTCWNYVLAAALQGSQCFFQGEAYIRQYPAPLAIYPLRTMLGGGFHFGLALGLVILLAAVLRGCPHPLALLTLLPTVLLLLVFGWALAILFGLTTVRFRDTTHLAEILFQILFYLTPIIYPPSMLEKRHLTLLLNANPLVPFLTLLRQPILDNQVPAPATFAAAGLIVLVTAGAAGLLLWREEPRLIFYL